MPNIKNECGDARAPGPDAIAIESTLVVHVTSLPAASKVFC
jgi:hypothetical protein